MTATLTKQTHLNSYTTDPVTASGVRISCPLYIDLTNQQRKELLNAAREAAHATTTNEVHSQSGISVATTSGGLNRIESYLGCSFEILRSSLFQRGGVNIDLVLRLQLATGLEIVSVKEIETALKSRISQVKAFVTDNPYN